MSLDDLVNPRATGEREAYLEGYEAGIRTCEQWGAEKARGLLEVVRESQAQFAEWEREGQRGA